MSELEFQHYPIDVNVIPSSWCVTSLSNLGADIQSGFPTGEHNREGRGIPHIRPMNIDRNGIIDFNDVKYVSPATSVLRLQVGDVLFNNTNSPELIGKTAAIQQCDEWGFSNHMTRLRFPAADLEYRFAAHQLHFLWIARYFRHRCVNHVNQASISGKPLALTVPFLVAPLIEQQRIIAKIEELFSDLDAGVAALKRAKANLKRYRASVLKAAVEGKLTEEWRADHPATEPASALLARILKERRQKWEADQLAKFAAANKEPPKNWRENYVEPTLPDTSGLPDLPNGWCWASVEQVASNEVYSITDGPFGSNLKSEHYQQSGPRVIRLQNIGDGDFNMVDSHISVTHFEKLQRHSVKAGDVVTAMLGEHLPRACLVPENIAPAIVKADCVKITVNRRLILPSYMVASLNAHSTRVRTLPKIAGVGRPRLNLEKLRPLPLPLPPILEQLEIERRLSEAFSQIQASHIHIDKSIIRASRLRQTILKQAFEGKLVPQDPTDEPASVLLERLRASRSVHEGSGKPTASVRSRGRRAKSKQASPPGEEAER